MGLRIAGSNTERVQRQTPLKEWKPSYSVETDRLEHSKYNQQQEWRLKDLVDVRETLRW